VGKLAAGWEEAGNGNSGTELVLRAWETGNLAGGLPALEEAYGGGARMDRRSAASMVGWWRHVSRWEAGGEHGWPGRPVWPAEARDYRRGRRRARLVGTARVASRWCS
jgi:hypothetical protein